MRRELPGIFTPASTPGLSEASRAAIPCVVKGDSVVPLRHPFWPCPITRRRQVGDRPLHTVISTSAPDVQGVAQGYVPSGKGLDQQLQPGIGSIASCNMPWKGPPMAGGESRVDG